MDNVTKGEYFYCCGRNHKDCLDNNRHIYIYTIPTVVNSKNYSKVLICYLYVAKLHKPLHFPNDWNLCMHISMFMGQEENLSPHESDIHVGISFSSTNFKCHNVTCVNCILQQLLNKT